MNQNRLNDPKGNTYVIFTIFTTEKYGETFYGGYTALIASCSEVK